MCVCVYTSMSGWNKRISLLSHIPSGWSELWLIIAESGVVWKNKQGGRVSYTHALHTHTRDHKHSREWDISVPDAAAGALSGKRNIQALGAGGRGQGSICGTPAGLRSLELVGPEINAMGNSNSKKKTQANLTSSHRTSRVKSIWHFRHVDKFKTGRKSCILELQSVYILHIVNYKFKIGGSKEKI